MIQRAWEPGLHGFTPQSISYSSSVPTTYPYWKLKFKARTSATCTLLMKNALPIFYVRRAVNVGKVLPTGFSDCMAENLSRGLASTRPQQHKPHRESQKSRTKKQLYNRNELSFYRSFLMGICLDRTSFMQFSWGVRHSLNIHLLTSCWSAGLSAIDNQPLSTIDRIKIQVSIIVD